METKTRNPFGPILVMMNGNPKRQQKILRICDEGFQRGKRLALIPFLQGMLSLFGAAHSPPLYLKRGGVFVLRALVLMFALSLTSRGFAVDETLNGNDTPVASGYAEQTFRFTYLRIPIGEVTFQYENWMGAQRRYNASLLSERANEAVGVDSILNHEDATQSGLGTIAGRKANSGKALLMGLRGKTNGLVSWLKDYEGHYQSRPSESGILYRVQATDRGYEEVREIEFRSITKRGGLPQVIAFKDRTAAEALKPNALWDAQSLDPVNLLRSLLQDIERLQGCPSKSISYRLFDGKRRYVGTLMDGVTESASEENVVTCILLLSRGSGAHDQVESMDGSDSPVQQETAEASALHSDLDDTNHEDYREALGSKTDRFTTQGVSSTLNGTGLFWPFNQSSLRAEFGVSFNEGVARYESFRIDSPFGKIKGSLVSD